MRSSSSVESRRLVGVGVPLVFSHERDDDEDTEDAALDGDAEELALQEGALDPDELEGDPLYWDEGADDEIG